ncbi:DMT family transporter [Janibacter alittae]|uniref:DMT family transporter n=1 Tax=Janibacter alittae TaxID=3115209 RepID=A0ABZ2MLA1_9MICO
MTIAIALAASVTWGTSDFIAGLLSARLPARTVVTCSQAVALVAISVVVLVIGLPLPPGSWWVWGALGGVAEGAGLLALYTGLARGPMGIVTPIAGLGVLVPVIVGLVQGDPVTVLLGAGILLAIAGGVLASGPEVEGRGEGGDATSILYAVLAAVGLGTAMVCVDLGSRVSGLHTLWAMRIASVGVFLVLAVVLTTRWRLPRRLVPGIIVVGLADLSATALFSAATTRGHLSIAGVLASLYPVTTILLAWLLLRERLRPVQLVGVAAALAGIALIAA